MSQEHQQLEYEEHIQNLEYELNTLLFYRTNRGIELTPEAKTLLVCSNK